LRTHIATCLKSKIKKFTVLLSLNKLKLLSDVNLSNQVKKEGHFFPIVAVKSTLPFKSLRSVRVGNVFERSICSPRLFLFVKNTLKQHYNLK